MCVSVDEKKQFLCFSNKTYVAIMFDIGRHQLLNLPLNLDLVEDHLRYISAIDISPNQNAFMALEAKLNIQ